MKLPPCILVLSENCPVCKTLLHFDVFQRFIQQISRLGCLVLDPQLVYHIPEAKEWAEKCGVIRYVYVDGEIEEAIQAPSFITPIDCVVFHVEPIPAKVLTRFLRSGEAHELRVKVRIMTLRALSLAKLACKAYGGCAGYPRRKRGGEG